MTSSSTAGPPPVSTITQQFSGEQQLSTVKKDQPLAAASPVQPAVTVAPADHVLTLVSSAVVNQRGFANTCGVPLGAHMDLQPSDALQLPRVTGRPPLRCNSCSAFLNMYCKTNLPKGVWKCPMCGGVNIHKDQLGNVAEGTTLAELCSEAVEYVAPVPPSHPLLEDAARSPPPPHLVFVVDSTLEPEDLVAVREALLTTLSSPCLDAATVVSLITVDGCVAVHNLGAQRCSHVLPTGAGVDLQAAVQQLLDRYCTSTAAWRAAATGTSGRPLKRSPADLSGGVLVSELATLVGPGGLLLKVLSSLRTVQPDVPLRARSRCTCLGVETALRLIAAHAALDLTRHQNLYGSRVIVLAGGPVTRGPGAVPLEFLDQAVSERGRAQENRTVAASLDVGAALGAMAARIGVPVDIWTSTSTGINAKLLTAISHGSGGEIMPQATLAALPHTHTSSSPALGPVPRCGGFQCAVLSRQLMGALSRRIGLEGRLDCYLSEGLRLVQWLGPLEAIQVDPEPPGPRAQGGTTAARQQPQTQPPAAGEVPAAAAHPASSGGDGPDGGPYRLSSLACGVAALDVGRGASLRLELTRDLDDVPSLLLQVALHFVDPSSRCRVVRVVTRKMAVVESRGEFLRTVNPTAAAAMLGKQSVLEAKKAGAFRDSRKAEEARYAVAAQLGLVASRCGQQVQAGRGMLGFGSRKSWQWPPELMPLAYALYHFQRGLLIGPQVPPPPDTFPAASHAHVHSLWDSDARLTGLNALLRAAWGDAYRAMAPKLYAVLPPMAADSGDINCVVPHSPQLLLVALPCVSLAAVMARTAPLLLDVGNAVLVSPTEEPGHGHGGDDAVDAGGGGALTPSLLRAALQAMAALNAFAGGGGTRFPVPSVVLAPGAQAGGGALSARLIPVHRDGYPQQCLQHPQLQQLGPAVAEQLSKQLSESAAAASSGTVGLPVALAKQVAAAAASFVEWCRGANVQPFPPSALTS